MEHDHHFHHLNSDHHGDDPDPDLDPSNGGGGDHLDPSEGRPGGQGHMAHGEMGPMNMNMMNMMKPVFQWVRDTPVLFESWTTSTAKELAAAILVAAFLAAAYEWLRHGLLVWDQAPHSLSHTPRWKRMCVRLLRALAHSVIAAVSYVQMLFAMTYNLRIFIAIILGCGIGFFFLGPNFRNRILRRKYTQNACATGKGSDVLDGNGDQHENRNKLIDGGGNDEEEEGRERGEHFGERGGGLDASRLLLSSGCGVDRETVL